MARVVHVELVREFVDDHVASARRQFARPRHLFPAEHDRPTVHGFARQFLAVAVHHAGGVGDFALGNGGARLHDDAHEIVVPSQQLRRLAGLAAVGQTHVQQRQAGLCRNAQCHGVGDGQAVGSVELFFLQEVGTEQAQLFPVCERQYLHEGQAVTQGLPQRLFNGRCRTPATWQPGLDLAQEGGGHYA